MVEMDAVFRQHWSAADQGYDIPLAEHYLLNVRKQMRRILCAVMMWAAVGMSTNAWGYNSGNDLWEHLTTDKSSPIYHQCQGQARGYVVGISDALDFRGEIQWEGTITKGQLVDVVEKYLRSHPESRHERAFFLVRRALMEAFPAKKQ